MSTHKALCAVMRQPDGARTMVGLVGGDINCNVAATALEVLSKELLMLSHYCAIGQRGDTAAIETLLFLEDALYSTSERAKAAGEVAAAELAVARESIGTQEAAE